MSGLLGNFQNVSCPMVHYLSGPQRKQRQTPPNLTCEVSSWLFSQFEASRSVVEKLVVKTLVVTWLVIMFLLT